ncbi:MAG: Transposase family protein, partial [Actinomyces urogenitalis DORA_12]
SATSPTTSLGRCSKPEGLDPRYTLVREEPPNLQQSRIIELGRRIARGFRNVEHYRLRMLLITGGLDASPHTQL